MATADVAGAERAFLALEWKMLSGFTGSSLRFQTHGSKRSQVPGAVGSGPSFSISNHGFSRSSSRICRVLLRLQGRTSAGLVVGADLNSPRSRILGMLEPPAAAESTHPLLLSSAVAVLDTVAGIGGGGRCPCLTAAVPGCLSGMGSRLRRLGDGCFHWG